MPNRPLETPAPITPWWGRIETLWLLAAPICAAFYALCLPLAPNDFWYHARAGWYIAHTGQLPTTNLFSSGVASSTPYFYQSWISEWLLYRTLNLGLAWVQVLRCVLLTGTISLIVWAAWVRCRSLGLPGLSSARLCALGGIFTVLTISNNLDIRPQSFSDLLFALYLALISQWPNKPSAWKAQSGSAFLVLLVIWANLHGAFPMALLLLGTMGLGLAIFKKDWSMLGLTFLGCLAVMINPHGAGIYAYLSKLANLPIGRLYIQEWQPPTWHEWHSAVWIFSPLLIGLAVTLRRRFTKNKPMASPYYLGLLPGEWLAGVVLYALGYSAVRATLWSMLWMGLALPAVAAACLMASKARSPEPAQPPRPRPYMNAVLLGLLMLAPVAILPWFKPLWPWPPAYAKRFINVPNKGSNSFRSTPPLLISADTPVAAAQYLKMYPPNGLLYNDMVYGSYLMWALYPRTKPSCDPRIELYSTAFWMDFFRINQGGKDAPEELKRRGYSDVLLDVTAQPKLVARLNGSPLWHLVANHGNSRLFRLR